MSAIMLFIGLAALVCSVIQLIRPIGRFGLNRRWHSIILFFVFIALMVARGFSLDADTEKKLEGYRQSDPDKYLSEIRKLRGDDFYLEEVQKLRPQLYSTEVEAVAKKRKEAAEAAERQKREEEETEAAEKKRENLRRIIIEQDKEAERILQERKNILNNLEKHVDLKKMDWWTDGFGSIMMADITLHNRSPITIKDIHIRCNLTASSGTLVGTAEKTIYDVVNSGQTKTFRKLNFGFIHEQAKRSGCSVVAAKPY